MSYETYEKSIEEGNPVELFLFELSGNRYAYTNGETAITHEGVVYSPEVITRGSVINEADKATQQTLVHTPSDNDFARLYINIPPGEIASISILEFHRTDNETQVITLFSGLVSTVSFKKKAKKAFMVCRPLSSSGHIQIPRRTSQVNCNWILYEGGCGILESTHVEYGFINQVNGRDITISGVNHLGAEDNYWPPGYIEVGQERRAIIKQTENVLRLSIEFRADVADSAMRILPGCDLLPKTCNDKFDNKKNYNGPEYMASINLFEDGIST